MAAGAVSALALTRPAPLTIRNVRIPVVDGPRDNQHVVLDANFFLPPGGGKVPAVLLAHGFGETKDAVRPQAEDLARAGFAVLTWSARGFGASTGRFPSECPLTSGSVSRSATSAAAGPSPHARSGSSLRKSG